MTEYTRLEESNFLNWDCLVKVDKYSLDQVRWVKRKTGLTNPSAEVLRETLKSLPSETAYGRGNLITTVGLGYLWSSITGVTTTVVAHQLSYSFLPVGVGDGNGSVPTAAVGDVDLTAATNKYYVPVDASYPQVGSGVSAGVSQCRPLLELQWPTLLGMSGAFLELLHLLLAHRLRLRPTLT